MIITPLSLVIRLFLWYKFQTMKKFLYILILLVFSLVLAGCTIPFIGKQKKAALQITSNPKTTVFLDDERLGSTPFFNDKIKAAEYKIRLVPENDAGDLSWEGRVKLVGGVLTVISRDLGNGEETSSGYVLSLEPRTDKSKTSAAVITKPDGAVVSVDGEPKGFAPLSIEDLDEGEHNLVISSPGFVEKSIKAKLIKGYKLIASVQLARMTEEEDEDEEDEEATESAKKDKDDEDEEKDVEDEEDEDIASAEPTPRKTDIDQDEPYIVIESAEIGWVRVREKPSTSSEEITKVNDGEEFRYLDTQSGWYQIEYEDGESGWISGKYAELYK